MLPDFIKDYLEQLSFSDIQLDITQLGGIAALTFVVGIMIARISSSSVAPTITVKWGREKLRLPLPPLDSKLSALRATISEQTGLEPGDYKLIHAGGVMKDNNSPLSAFGIKKGSVLVIVDGAAQAKGQIVPEKRDEKKSKPTTEEGSKDFIREELERVNTMLAPDLDKFLQAIDDTSTSTPTSTDEYQASATTASAPAQPTPSSTVSASQPTTPEVDLEHLRLGECFLQSLLKLDELQLDRAWEEARSERKGAIKAVQSLLDRLDKGWRERQKRLTAAQ